jgi:uncharacterized protein HemY
MPASTAQHSHRNTTKVSHKPFKARKSTKGALKEIQKGRFSAADRGAYLTANRQSPRRLLNEKNPAPATYV